jgi:hypothetical protein
MKKLYFGILMLLISFSGCKKSDKAVVDPTNLELTVTCDCTFDINVIQRENTTLKYYNITNLSGVSKSYDVKLNAETKDLLEIQVRNASVPPYQIKVMYKGSSLLDQSSLSDANGNYNVYMP